MSFKYDEELPVVVSILLFYAVLCYSGGILLQMQNGSACFWVSRWGYGLFTVSQIVTPLLPMALKVGQTMAARRLKEMGTLCMNPERIAISGKVHVFCFDKTGTLTKEGLDFRAIHCVTGEGGSFGELAEEVDTTAFGYANGGKEGQGDVKSMVKAMATCHAVTRYNDTFVGNQVEVRMLGATGWNLVEQEGQAPKVEPPGTPEDSLKIVKRFEFDHAKQTMSVVVKKGDEPTVAYAKGSFEKMKDLCTPDSLPALYDDVARNHASDGCYVLAVGVREVGPVGDDPAVERDMIEEAGTFKFIGLLLFRNELKGDTEKAILGLRDGNCRCVMITGDNAHCGSYIAKRCGMLDSETTLLLGELSKSGEVLWKPIGLGVSGEAQSTASLYEDNALDGVELGVTGKAFDVLIENGDLPRLLMHMRIFARMSPVGKVRAVRLFMDRGFITGMCGDGGNDCGALRAAHVGVALSEAEASVVSPFTSDTKSVMSCMDLIREGRASLATSFASYKFLIVYGQLFSLIKLCGYYFGTIMSPMAYATIDAAAVVVLSYFMTLSEPKSRLSKERPSSSLLSNVTIASVCGMHAMNVTIMTLCLRIIVAHPEYVKWPAEYTDLDHWWNLSNNWESSVLFAVAFPQFITAAVIFSFGSKHRKNVIQNVGLIVGWAIFYTFASAILLMDPNYVTYLYHMASENFNGEGSRFPIWATYQMKGGKASGPMDFNLRLQIWFIIGAGLILNVLWEFIFIIGPGRHWLFPRRGVTHPDLKP